MVVVVLVVIVFASVMLVESTEYRLWCMFVFIMWFRCVMIVLCIRYSVHTVVVKVWCVFEMWCKCAVMGYSVNQTFVL